MRPGYWEGPNGTVWLGGTSKEHAPNEQLHWEAAFQPHELKGHNGTAPAHLIYIRLHKPGL